MANVDGFPFVNPTVRHVGVSKLRELNASKLRENSEETLVIQDSNDTPLAVLLSYEQFLIIQQQLMAVLNTVEMLSDKEEHDSFLAAFEDIRSGRVRSLDEIDAELEKQYTWQTTRSVRARPQHKSRKSLPLTLHVTLPVDPIRWT